MSRSHAIFADYQSKLEAANERKKHYISEARESAKDMNSQIEVAHSFWNEMSKVKEESYIKQLVSKFERAERA